MEIEFACGEDEARKNKSQPVRSEDVPEIGQSLMRAARWLSHKHPQPLKLVLIARDGDEDLFVMTAALENGRQTVWSAEGVQDLLRVTAESVKPGEESPKDDGDLA